MARDLNYKTIHDYVKGYAEDFEKYGLELEAGIYSVVIKDVRCADEDTCQVACVSPYALDDILKFMPMTYRIAVERVES